VDGAGDLVFPKREYDFPEIFFPLFEPKRFKIAYGGRNGIKSHSFARAILIQGTQRTLRVLCAREIQKSLKNSVRQLLIDCIAALELGMYYTALRDEIRHNANGTTLSFTGLQEHTDESIKSFEGIDIAWIEEARSVSASSWIKLINTIRKPGSEIWASFNPHRREDYVYDRFVVGKDPEAWVIKTSYRDNEWLSPEMETERRRMKRTNADLYGHIYLGKCVTSAGVMFKRRWFKRFRLGRQPKRLRLYLSSDYAVTDPTELEDTTREPDFTEFGVFGVDENGEVWLVDWYSEQADPQVWIRVLVNMLRKHGIRLMFEEAGVIHRSQKSAIDNILRRKRVRVHREALPSAGGKAERAIGFMALASQGVIHIPEGPEWAERLVNQLCDFTGDPGNVDDGVDVCSLFARGLDFVASAAKRPKKGKKLVPFTRAWFEANEDGNTEDEEFRKRQFYGR
jgi:predicted phage terminase large subunit-like protein